MEWFGYIIIAVLAAYLIPRLISAAFFQSWKDFDKERDKNGQEH